MAIFSIPVVAMALIKATSSVEFLCKFKAQEMKPSFMDSCWSRQGSLSECPAKLLELCRLVQTRELIGVANYGSYHSHNVLLMLNPNKLVIC
jgi:hypothetical protein